MILEEMLRHFRTLFQLILHFLSRSHFCLQLISCKFSCPERALWALIFGGNFLWFIFAPCPEWCVSRFILFEIAWKLCVESRNENDWRRFFLVILGKIWKEILSEFDLEVFVRMMWRFVEIIRQNSDVVKIN